MAQYIKTEEGYKGLEESISTVTDNKMDKTNPTGTGSFSMNRKAGTVVGTNSHTEGFNTTASQSYSHAEGSSTQASGLSSHSEGYQATASGQNSHAEGNQTTASGSSSHAEGISNKASGYSSHAEGNYTTASGDISHAEGFYTKASGAGSHAEGNSTIAGGQDSHSEGYQTTASGQNSHAEGYQTTASREYSHAEGNSTIASGGGSHAEGFNTTASEYYSHAEGSSTIASGWDSHAEGSHTTASGGSSHAEGNNTIASGDYSHAQGKLNIEDTSSIYADIIGNGTIVNGTMIKRSNAATVDWEGNAWYAGDVYTGSTSGTNKDDGSKKLATEEYVNSSIAAGGTDISLGLTSAAVGQTIKVKAIDESGKPTEWEAVEEKTLKWIKVHESTLTENTNIISVGADESGKELQEYNPIGIALVVSTPADATQTNNNGQVWAYPQKNTGDNAIRIISTIAGWKTVNRDSIWIWQGGSTALAYNGNNNGASPAYKVNNYAMNGVYAYIPDTKDHFPVGSTVLVSVLTEM